LITILNRCHRFRGFVYQHAYFSADKKNIEVAVRPRKGSAAVCSRCHLPAPGYDQLAERRFEFIPLWGFLVFLLYTMRRVDCRRCGVVTVEEVPWGDGKRTLTKAYMLFLARWARRLSRKENGGGLSYILGQGVRRGRTCRHLGSGRPDARPNRAIGVDEIQYSKGHRYLTLVYQIDLGVIQQLWDYSSPAWAGKFLDEWYRQTMRSRIEPMKKIARSLRQHRELILNYFRAQKLNSSGVVEGLNNKAKVTLRKSYGFRTYRVLELALYHSLGNLPEPESTPDFF
jgi:transposase